MTKENDIVDNKIENTIKNTHPIRTELIEQFFDLIYKSVSLESYKDMILDLDITMKDGTVEKTSERLNKNWLKESSIKCFNELKQALYDNHGRDFGGKRIKFTMEILENFN